MPLFDKYADWAPTPEMLHSWQDTAQAYEEKAEAAVESSHWPMTSVRSQLAGLIERSVLHDTVRAEPFDGLRANGQCLCRELWKDQ